MKKSTLASIYDKSTCCFYFRVSYLFSACSPCSCCCHFCFTFDTYILWHAYEIGFYFSFLRLLYTHCVFVRWNQVHTNFGRNKLTTKIVRSSSGFRETQKKTRSVKDIFLLLLSSKQKILINDDHDHICRTLLTEYSYPMVEICKLLRETKQFTDIF